MPELASAAIVGLLALVIVFKVLKLAIKVAFLVALGAGAAAAYLTYAAT
ncbi:MAG: hypothetical protein ACRBI6_05785 [Acidimicrobiales bacterium]